jgi:hypothetical protein
VWPKLATGIVVAVAAYVILATLDRWAFLNWNPVAAAERIIEREGGADRGVA